MVVPRPLTLSAIARGERAAAISRIESAISSCGWLVEARAFSGLYMSFQVELERPRLGGFAQRMRDAGAPLDAPSEAALAAEASVTPAEGAVPAALGVTFPDGNPDQRQVIPPVPG
ncbi:hypothetical protein ATI61_11645 [Archangium gephyra]|uniref:Uncharacterized protein n=1 Tax=Archangium gephyra TaxID=48 RepID=A0AAC8TGR9_9BACT|nr:hypothetical protein [Archangium gephyra]AKJ03796.1 Hypothetical protein AA314_05422 [Archangium gephyra]REG23575.1 hypothetical protein ATI61_11645 [Archangium gephyra]